MTMDGKTRLDRHEVAVVHESAPDARSGNGFRYCFGIKDGDSEHHPLAICHAREKWVGNFWRHAEDLPESVPECVKKEVAEALPYEFDEISFEPRGESNE